MTAKKNSPGKSHIVTTSCCSHCGGLCLLRAHVVDCLVRVARQHAA